MPYRVFITDLSYGHSIFLLQRIFVDISEQVLKPAAKDDRLYLEHADDGILEDVYEKNTCEGAPQNASMPSQDETTVYRSANRAEVSNFIFLSSSAIKINTIWSYLIRNKSMEQFTKSCYLRNFTVSKG